MSEIAGQAGRFWKVVILAAAAIGVLLIASTWRLLSQTIDEPSHINAGMEWFDGTYVQDTEHPPLARVILALPARLTGHRIPRDVSGWTARGNAFLYSNDEYAHNLVLARCGNLLFFLAGFWSVVLWSRHLFSDRVAALAALLFAFLPPILGHAGLATTDMAAAGTVGLAHFAWMRWLQTPDRKRVALLALAIAAGVLSKFSFLLYFPLGAIVIAAVLRADGARRPSLQLSVRVPQLGAAAGFVMLSVWAAYHFQYATAVSTIPAGAMIAYLLPGPLQSFGVRFASEHAMPAPAFFIGIGQLKAHALTGHLAFLRGRYSQWGFGSYFPVAFLYKTPIPIEVLLLAGAWFLLRDAVRSRERVVRLIVLLFPVLAMLTLMTTTIDIGLRHMLPLYPMVVVVAAAGLARLWDRAPDGSLDRLLAVALVAWLACSTIASRPDYVGWFNALDDAPQDILTDSNIDWGQDFIQLRAVLRLMKIERISLVYFGVLDLSRMRFPAYRLLAPFEPACGWVAVSETPLKLANPDHGRGYRWVESYRPIRRVGSSIRLLYVPCHAAVSVP